MRGEELLAGVYVQVEHVRDVLALEPDRERLRAVALALTDVAGDEHVAQEVHLDAHDAVALARLAAAALQIEAEARGAPALHARLRELREEGPDVVEGLRVGAGVAARRAPDGLLIDGDDLVDRVDALHPAVLADPVLRVVEAPRELRQQDAVDEGALAGAARPRDRHEAPERDADVDVLQVVLARAADDELALRAPPLPWDLDATPPGDVVRGEAPLGLRESARRPFEAHLAAHVPRTRPEIDDVIGGADGALVVLDDQDGIAEVAQVIERLHESRRVACVQPDARFVEHVEHAGELAPELARQADALCLSAGEGGARAIERQVLQAHVEEELETALDLAKRALRDRPLGARERHLPEPLVGIADGQGEHLGDAAPTELHREALGAQPLSLAGVAADVAQVLAVLFAHLLGARLQVAAHQVRDHSLELDAPGPVRIRPFLAPRHADLLAAEAVEHLIAELLRELAEGHVQIDAGRLRYPLDDPKRPSFAALHRGRPGRNRALPDGQRRIRDDEDWVDLRPRPEAVARGAHPDRRVEREALRALLRVAHSAARARRREAERRLALGLHDELARALAKGELDGLRDAGARRGLHRDAIEHELDGVLPLLVDGGEGVQTMNLAVDAHAHEAARRQIGEDVTELALAVRDERREKEHGPPRQREHVGRDLLAAAAAHRLATRGAVLHPRTRPEDAHVVVELGDRPDGGARVRRGALLLDGDGRREPAQPFHRGPVQATQELARVRRERLDVASLPLRVEGVEREAALAGPARPRQDDHGVLRQHQVVDPEVMLARARDLDDGVGARAGPRNPTEALRGVAVAHCPPLRSTAPGHAGEGPAIDRGRPYPRRPGLSSGREPGPSAWQ